MDRFAQLAQLCLSLAQKRKLPITCAKCSVTYAKGTCLLRKMRKSGVINLGQRLFAQVAQNDAVRCANRRSVSCANLSITCANGLRKMRKPAKGQGNFPGTQETLRNTNDFAAERGFPRRYWAAVRPSRYATCANQHASCATVHQVAQTHTYNLRK